MIEIAIVAGLILLNGMFAMSELAIVSASKPLLRSMSERGRPGAKAAFALAENPGKFLSTVQIGITLVGIVAGAFSGATLGGAFAAYLDAQGLSPTLASALGYGGVVAAITYLSVVIGELVPKQFALRNAETIACIVAGPMTVLSIIAAPVVWFLDFSTRMIFRLLRQPEVSSETVTEEEIKALVAEAAASGVIETDEKRMIAAVLQLSDSTARTIMTPRTDVTTLALQASPETMRKILTTTRHTRLPVYDGDPDNIIGVVIIRECLVDGVPDSAQKLRKYIRQAPVVPEMLGALDVLRLLRDARIPIALVHDEYGHFEGVITPSDLLEAIAGIFLSDIDPESEEGAIQREDGSWLLGGMMPAHLMAELLGLSLPPRRDYQTAAGFVIDTLQRLPRTGEYADVDGWRLEIVDMDGRRIDKILATPRTIEN